MDTNTLSPAYTPQIPQPVVNPADMTDPDAQRKTAEDVLSQLGLHPNQAGARNLLDMHFQGPTADPEVAKTIAPIVTPQTATAPTATETLPKIPGPGAVQAPSITNNTGNRTLADQGELDRLIKTGSGISQIQNPLLRGLAHVGDIGADIFLGRGAGIIPGTDVHHGELVQGAQNRIKTDLSQASQEAQTAHENQETATSLNAPPKTPDELQTWINQNPGKPIEEYWKAKAAANGGKLTPEEMLMHNMIAPVTEGGQGLSMEAAFQQMQKDKATAKPPSASGNKIELENLLAKGMPGGQLDPKLMSDPKTLGNFISNNTAYSDEEKGKLFSHFVFNTSPASAGGIAHDRATSSQASRLTPAIDSSSGSLALVTPNQVTQHPGQYIPATQGAQSLGKEALISDIRYNSSNVRQAVDALQNGFDSKARAQIALMLSSSNPHSAFESFMKGETASTLTPDQVDYVTALASLNENAMSLRSIGGMGQGSDDLRAAIKGSIPGAGTPDKNYAHRQLDLFDGTVNRLATGIPKTGVQHPEALPTPKTQPNNPQPPKQGKVFTHQQVQNAATAANMTYEAAKADAIAHGHTVRE